VPALVESAWPFHQTVSSAQSRTAPIARRAAVLGPVKTGLAIPGCWLSPRQFGFQIGFRPILDVRNLEKMFWACFLLSKTSPSIHIRGSWPVEDPNFPSSKIHLLHPFTPSSLYLVVHHVSWRDLATFEVALPTLGQPPCAPPRRVFPGGVQESTRRRTGSTSA
jgi:hypothetical protein